MTQPTRKRDDCSLHTQWFAQTPVPRRRFLATVSGTAAVATGGCLGEAVGNDAGAIPPEPIALGGSKACDACGMIIGAHFGPSGQVFYQNEKPDGRDGPAWFDSVRELITANEEHERGGWEVLAIYVTDYSSVEYDIEVREERQHISAHTERAAYGPAEALTFVVDSDVEGAMGPDWLPFGDADEARSFVDGYGGTLQSLSDLKHAPSLAEFSSRTRNSVG